MSTDTQHPNLARERVSLGARLLDDQIPGWAEHIDLDSLDMGETDVIDGDELATEGGCILCQVDLAITTHKRSSFSGQLIVRPGQTPEEAMDDEAFLASFARGYDGESGFDEEGRDPLDNTPDSGGGSYLKLARELGLWSVGEQVRHGFSADAKVRYGDLDALWTTEVQARRAVSPGTDAH